jgi:Family of unknown function (DUF5678)
MSDPLTETKETGDKLRIKTQKLRGDVPTMFEPSPMISQIVDYADSVVMLLSIAAQQSRMPPVITAYSIKEDFDWFTSGHLDTDSFKGQYIAIWKKQIVGTGKTPLEAETLAKAYYGDDCRPTVIYSKR